MKKTRLDLVGKRFGKLAVLEFDIVKGGRAYWRCMCDCGKKKVVGGSHLVNGGTKSCGCLYKVSESAYKKTHGGCGTKLYSIYRGMLQRCNSSNATNYKNYGGRGIRVLWGDYSKFRDDMLDSYIEHRASNKTTTIERIDVNGDYTRLNCCRATNEEQQKNKRIKGQN